MVKGVLRWYGNLFRKGFLQITGGSFLLEGIVAMVNGFFDLPSTAKGSFL
jgi:hypothetical protein